jgi:CRISPR system Cascade subunit CasE
LLVQSASRPDFTRLPQGFLDLRAGGDSATSRDISEVLPALVPGASFRFRLRANPTRKIDTKSGPDGKRRNGRRVPVRLDEGRLRWVDTRLLAHGFKVLECEVRPDGKQVARVGAQVRTHDAFVFDGTVEIVDADRARAALRSGVGPGKAYGFGLLSLAVRG